MSRRLRWIIRMEQRLALCPARNFVCRRRQYRDARRCPSIGRDRKVWILQSSDAGALPGARLVTEGFDRELALSAQGGSAFKALPGAGERLCRCVYRSGSLLVVSVGRYALEASVHSTYYRSAQSAWRLTALFASALFYHAGVDQLLPEAAYRRNAASGGRIDRRVRLKQFKYLFHDSSCPVSVLFLICVLKILFSDCNCSNSLIF